MKMFVGVVTKPVDDGGYFVKPIKFIIKRHKNFDIWRYNIKFEFGTQHSMEDEDAPRYTIVTTEGYKEAIQELFNARFEGLGVTLTNLREIRV